MDVVFNAEAKRSEGGGLECGRDLTEEELRQDQRDAAASDDKAAGTTEGDPAKDAAALAHKYDDPENDLDEEEDKKKEEKKKDAPKGGQKEGILHDKRWHHITVLAREGGGIRAKVVSAAGALAPRARIDGDPVPTGTPDEALRAFYLWTDPRKAETTGSALSAYGEQTQLLFDDLGACWPGCRGWDLARSALRHFLSLVNQLMQQYEGRTRKDYADQWHDRASQRLLRLFPPWRCPEYPAEYMPDSIAPIEQEPPAPQPVPGPMIKKAAGVVGTPPFSAACAAGAITLLASVVVADFSVP
eukprot:gene12902-48187_t